MKVKKVTRLKNTLYLFVLISSALTLSSIALSSEHSINTKSIGNNFLKELDVSLRLNFDANRFDGVYREDRLADDHYDSQLRRARLSLKLPLGNNWSSKVQFAINEGEENYETKDLYLRYKGFNFADIKIGQAKEPFGLENVTSSGNSIFTERSLSIFALGRSKGINFADSNKRYSWSLGTYKVAKNGKVKADGDKAYTARVTVSPINKDNNYNHFGLAYSTRDLQGAEYEIKTNGGVDNAFSFLDTRNIATDTIVKKGVEAAWGRGQLSLQGEYQYLQIDALDIDESASYQGYYTQLSYFLTNDHRPYKKGRFSSVKPNSGKGAWELTLRKSALQSVEIGSANKNSHIDIETTVLGVNYYLTKCIKFMLNATDTETQGITSYNLTPEGSALSLRLQIKL
jgi:phosphate-selective porin OprO/OprP